MAGRMVGHYKKDQIAQSYQWCLADREGFEPSFCLGHSGVPAGLKPAKGIGAVPNSQALNLASVEAVRRSVAAKSAE